MSTIVPINKLRSGENTVTISYDGSSIVNRAYVGGALSLVRFAEYPKLKLDIEELSFNKNGGTDEVVVVSNATWSASTSSSWLTITTASTGFTVTASVNDTEADRSGVITVTAWNVNASVSSSITVEQNYIPVVYVPYIHAADMVTNSDRFIALGIYPTIATSGRITGKMQNYTTGMVLVGQYPTGSDNQDWRVFFTARGSFYMDVGSSRTNGNIGNILIGDDIDISFGNLFVLNNISGNKISGSTSTSTIQNVQINVCVGVIWVSTVQLWEGETLIFDAAAAELGGKYGLYDSISGDFYTNDNFPIVAES